MNMKLVLLLTLVVTFGLVHSQVKINYILGSTLVSCIDPATNERQYQSVSTSTVLCRISGKNYTFEHTLGKGMTFDELTSPDFAKLVPPTYLGFLTKYYKAADKDRVFRSHYTTSPPAVSGFALDIPSNVMTFSLLPSASGYPHEPAAKSIWELYSTTLKKTAYAMEGTTAAATLTGAGYAVVNTNAFKLVPHDYKYTVRACTPKTGRRYYSFDVPCRANDIHQEVAFKIRYACSTPAIEPYLKTAAMAPLYIQRSNTDQIFSIKSTNTKPYSVVKNSAGVAIPFGCIHTSGGEGLSKLYTHEKVNLDGTVDRFYCIYNQRKGYSVTDTGFYVYKA